MGDAARVLLQFIGKPDAKYARIEARKVDIASGENGFAIKPNWHAPDKHILIIHVTSRHSIWVGNECAAIAPEEDQPQPNRYAKMPGDSSRRFHLGSYCRNDFMRQKILDNPIMTAASGPIKQR